MKRLIQILTPMLILVVMASCTKEGPEGPMGPQGEQGEVGPQGPAGEDGQVTCNECHTESEDMMVKTAEWATSGHVNNGHMEGYYASRDGCADCHSSQGFRHVVATGEWGSSAPEKPLPANCYTCHKIHETYTADDWGLRQSTAVELITNMVSTDQGSSNTCVQCHQSRTHEPLLDPTATETVQITNKRFGPHHGPQGNMMAGAGNSGAYEITGSASYSDGMHVSASSCTSCHMASGAGSSGNMALGGHSFNVGTGEWEPEEGESGKTINANGCTSCHSSWEGNSGATDIVLEKRTANLASIQELRQKLLDLNYIDASDYLLGDDGATNASSTNPLTVSQAHAAAIYNFKFVVEDQSSMIHNPAYAKALVTNSLEALNN